MIYYLLANIYRTFICFSRAFIIQKWDKDL